MSTEPAESDAGSGTVWVLCVLFVLAVVAGSVIVLAGTRALQAQASAAADLAALAAADDLQHHGSSEGACARAGRVAGRNAAVLEGCVVVGDVVAVTVLGRAVGPGGLRARADARAGPVGVP